MPIRLAYSKKKRVVRIVGLNPIRNVCGVITTSPEFHRAIVIGAIKLDLNGVALKSDLDVFFFKNPIVTPIP